MDENVGKLGCRIVPQVLRGSRRREEVERHFQNPPRYLGGYRLFEIAVVILAYFDVAVRKAEDSMPFFIGTLPWLAFAQQQDH